MVNWASIVTAIVFAFIVLDPSILSVIRKSGYLTSEVSDDGYVQSSMMIIPVSIAAVIGYMAGPFVAKTLAPVLKCLAPVGDYAKRLGGKLVSGGKKLIRSAPSLPKPAAAYTPGVDASTVDPSIANAEKSEVEVEAKQSALKPLQSADSSSHSQGTDLAASSVKSTEKKEDKESKESISEKSGGVTTKNYSDTDVAALAIMAADSQISLNRRINVLSAAQDGRRSTLTRALTKSSRTPVSRRSTGAVSAAAARQQA